MAKRRTKRPAAGNLTPKALMKRVELRKLQPKLRMFMNGSSAVNIMRAEQASALWVESERALKQPRVCKDDSAPLTLRQLPKAAKRGKLKSLAANVYVNVFVTATDPRAELDVVGQCRRHGPLVSARVPLSELAATMSREAFIDQVAHVELAETLTDPTPVIAAGPANAPLPRAVTGADKHRNGEGVLIGIIDVQGFDFSHPDFLDEQGATRFEAIWDQGGSVRVSPKAFDYGAEFRKAHLDAALRAAPTVGAPAWELERQSQLAAGSHGTHVASIAAGKRGVCPKAKIAAVLISMGEEDLDRRKSFYDSTRIVDAVDYLLALGDELGLPVSINISLGTNGHAHDGSSAASRWIDMALTTPGRSVCLAAGNAGQEKPETPDDMGFVMGRIHTSGRIAARDLTQDVEWVVVGNSVADISENELEFWYSPGDRFAISVRPPDGNWIGPVEPGEFIENRQLSDGSFMSVYNELYHPANGANYIAVYLSPFYTEPAPVGVKAGTWVVRLHGREVRNGQYHAWIERDDPRPVGRHGAKQYWSFPSFFTERSNVDESSISSMACGQNVVAVANLDAARDTVNISSSQGPTRDGRSKPDIGAPGTDIVAAKAFSGPDDLWVSMTGTSMASPYVAGVVGLMLAANKKLTAAQILGILQRTARPLPGADFAWQNDAGYGAVDPGACVLEAVAVTERRDRT